MKSDSIWRSACNKSAVLDAILMCSMKAVKLNANVDPLFYFYLCILSIVLSLLPSCYLWKNWLLKIVIHDEVDD